MERANPRVPPKRRSPRGGGDTLAIWRRQGKASRIKALPRTCLKSKACLSRNRRPEQRGKAVENPGQLGAPPSCEPPAGSLIHSAVPNGGSRLPAEFDSGDRVRA